MENPFSDQTDVMVLNIQRYITDPLFRQQTGLSVISSDAYDITITDGKFKNKLVLSCDFNQLVQKKKGYVSCCKLREGVHIRLVKVKMRADETSLDPLYIPVIEDMILLDDKITSLDNLSLSDIPWHPGNEVQKELHPLASSRGYYLDLWSNADVECFSHANATIHSDLGDVTSTDLYTLKEIIRKWKDIQSLKPHLLVRVMRRSRLVHYARPDKQDKWPFQLPVVVGDHTGCCVVIFWNVLGPQYLSHLSEGQVLLLRNFRVKPKFPLPQHLLWRQPGLPWYDVDLSLNPHHPIGEITLLNDSVLDDLVDTDLPLPASNFVTRKQLSSIPDNYICDIAGVITFVSITQRERMKVKQGACGGFWIKRWVFIQDYSSSCPTVIELFRGTQKQLFEENLIPGMLMVCRNVRVVHGLDHLQTSHQCRYIFVTSTNDTQIYVHNTEVARDYPFGQDTTLQAILNWAQDADCEIIPDRRLQQIFFSYPPLPVSLQTLSEQKNKLEMIPSEAWKPYVEKMCYKETAQMTFQAKLISVLYFKKKGRRTSRVLRRTKQQQFQSMTDAPVMVWENREASADFIDIGYKHFHSSQQEASSSQGTGDQYVDTDLDNEDFLLLQWQGLNANVILNTMKPCYFKECPRSMTLAMCLSGALDSAPGEACVGMSREALQNITKSLGKDKEESIHRFVIILDMHCVNGDTTLMAVNRAFPLR